MTNGRLCHTAAASTGPQQRHAPERGEGGVLAPAPLRASSPPSRCAKSNRDAFRHERLSPRDKWTVFVPHRAASGPAGGAEGVSCTSALAPRSSEMRIRVPAGRMRLDWGVELVMGGAVYGFGRAEVPVRPPPQIGVALSPKAPLSSPGPSHDGEGLPT